jgi:aldehyde dehydrogenase (NAD+)
MSEEQVLSQIPSIVSRLRDNFSQAKPSVEWRKNQLRQLIKMIQENRKEICDALSKDLGNLPEFANFNETGPTIQEAEFALNHIDEWVKPEQRNVSIFARPAKGYVHKEPYGLALIISPWNYPFRLLTFPLVGAIAAGNAIICKPSEVSKHTSGVIKRLFDKYLDQNYIYAVEGGVAVASVLLSQKFDYIFYTGNTEVGRIVMKAAAEHLTPVTLELGGKSPVIVDKTCNLDVTVNRILFGKFMNVGQTCVAPDYILVERGFEDKLINGLKDRLKKWYSEDPKASKSYSRIVNERHTARLQKYLEEVRDKIVHGGKVDVNEKYVEPTIILDPNPKSKLMQEEIFGPILPILRVDNVNEALRFVNGRPKPLALYIFSQNEQVQKQVIENSSSGGVCVNGTIFQIINPEIQFGGVGPSGIGGYNGKFSFDTFSHQRGVVKKALWLDPEASYPPWTPDKLNSFNMVADGIKIPKGLIYASGAAVAATTLYFASKL